mmetsp:Transcript_51331/g.134786  ORF Transcript_51331/g.134786 Transcript_51331/m.134786 type:complete len:395 (-) Transcript_51331:774-1958(-)
MHVHIHPSSNVQPCSLLGLWGSRDKEASPSRCRHGAQIDLSTCVLAHLTEDPQFVFQFRHKTRGAHDAIVDPRARAGEGRRRQAIRHARHHRRLRRQGHGQGRGHGRRRSDDPGPQRGHGRKPHRSHRCGGNRWAAQRCRRHRSARGSNHNTRAWNCRCRRCCRRQGWPRCDRCRLACSHEGHRRQRGAAGGAAANCRCRQCQEPAGSGCAGGPSTTGGKAEARARAGGGQVRTRRASGTSDWSHGPHNLRLEQLGQARAGAQGSRRRGGPKRRLCLLGTSAQAQLAHHLVVFCIHAPLFLCLRLPIHVFLLVLLHCNLAIRCHVAFVTANRTDNVSHLVLHAFGFRTLEAKVAQSATNSTPLLSLLQGEAVHGCKLLHSVGPSVLELWTFRVQ